MPQIPKELSDRIEANLAEANRVLADMDELIASQKKLISLCKRDDPMTSAIPPRRSTDLTVDSVSELVESWT